ncbi:dolichol phosphate-mannose biosynthesis regulatory [Gigaspora margarita]|uniref:Dolichol phosphate-mannose biosynthesis regulatory protein n=2 Tax=Gigaspora TaxID=4873 RepID=A0A8H4ESP8_GIGMA|nr:dolichol phosphate-mannose biosynthesis regulatory [Gigaspora margarita]
MVSGGQDRAIGATLLLSSASLFAYYTIWALIMPFVDDGHPLHEYFPDRKYAIIIPVVLLLFGLTVIFTFLALVMIKSSGTKKGVKKA